MEAIVIKWEYLSKAKIWEYWEGKVLLAVITDVSFDGDYPTGTLKMCHHKPRKGPITALKQIVRERVNEDLRENEKIPLKLDFN